MDYARKLQLFLIICRKELLLSYGEKIQEIQLKEYILVLKYVGHSFAKWVGPYQYDKGS